MGVRPKPPTRVPTRLRQPEEIAPPVEHVPPVVPIDELAVSEQLVAVLDKAQAEGKADAGDGREARALDVASIEVGVVTLPKSKLIYANPANPRRPVAETWIPGAILQNTAVDGCFHYLAARRLLVEPSVPIHAGLEV